MATRGRKKQILKAIPSSSLNAQEALVSLPAHQQAAVKARAAWLAMARPKQLPPPGDWTVFLMLAGRGFGKALALDTPIATPTGWSTMGELQLGDQVFDEKGNVCQIIDHSPIMEGRPCYRVNFSDGSEIVADADHRWFTWDKSARKAHCRAVNPTKHPQVRTTEQIAASLMAGKERNHAIEVCRPLELPEVALPIDPYLLGVWLGDGHKVGGSFTCVDMGIIDALRARGVDVAHVSQIMWSLNKRSPCRDLTTGRMCGNGSLTSILKANGLYRHKHIPAIYMRASRTQRLDLFQGLMDTDGSVTPNGHCEFTNTNLTLANDFFDLAITLGLKPVFASGDATLNGRFISKKYRITFTPYFPVFKLDRKLARQNKTPTKRTLRFITGVTPVDSVPVRCIAVDSPSHLFLAGRTMIPTHNTKAGAEETWWRAAYFGQRCAVVAATTNDLWRVCFEGESGILNCVPPSVLVGGKIDIGYNKTHSEIHFQSGGVIQGFTAESPERLRGPQFHYAWCDELASWNNFDTWEQLMMTLRLGRRPQIVATTTPKPVPLVRELASPPSEKYPNGRAGVDTIVVSGSSYENEENLSKMFFKNVERKSGTRMSRQEIYAELLEDIDGALWTIKMIEDAHLKEPCPTRSFFKRIVVSVDPAMTNTNTSDSTGIVVVALGEDELGYILEDATMKASPNDWGKKVIELYHKWHADVIVAESTQGGDIVRGVILQHDRWANVKDVRERTGKWLRAEPIAALYEQKRIKHIKPFIALEDQMTHFTKDKVKYTDNDRVDALVYGFAELMQEEVIPPAKFIRRAFMRR